MPGTIRMAQRTEPYSPWCDRQGVRIGMTLKHPTGGFLYSGLPGFMPTFRTECQHSHSISNSRQATVKAALVSAQSANDEQKRRADWAIQNCEEELRRSKAEAK
ncbi:unnamed protein product, partial [Effrenium voratum]